MKELILGVLLMFGALYDIKHRSISIKYIQLFFLTGVLILIMQGNLNKTFSQYALGLMIAFIPGILMILLARISNEQIGYGDGIIVLLIGLFLNIHILLGIVLCAIFLAGLMGVILFIFRNRIKTKGIPFLPFIFVSYLFQIL